MPPQGHAKLSPSAAERWIQCPASVRMIQQYPVEESDSVYAVEGNAAHALAEISASLEFGHIDDEAYRTRLQFWRKQYPQFQDSYDEMREHVRGYLDLIAEHRAQHPNSQVLLEQRLDTGVPTCWGTSDTVIVSPTHVEIIDLKYGQGVPVAAQGNPQLRLYGSGALEAFDGLLGDVETVTMTVHQPRLRSTSSETLTAAELRKWRDAVAEIAVVALGDDAPFGPSEDACRWCPVAGRCRAQVEAATQLDFGDPALVSPAEMAALLEEAPRIKQWLAQLEKKALDLVYSQGVPIPGWKVVRSGGRRTLPDQEGALAYLKSLGFTPDSVSTRKLNTLGELEKTVANFDEVMEAYIVKTEGNPSLVPEADRRPAISPNTEAQKDFLEFTEGTDK